jgi:hypothetical protein
MFITTLLMVVLLVAAVSTATWAWFSTNATVQAGGGELSAAQISGVNLGIGWGTGAAAAPQGSSSITFGAASVAAIDPMMPKTDLAGTPFADAINPAHANSFTTQTIAAGGTNVGMFNGNGINATPAVLQNATAVQTIIIANNSAFSATEGVVVRVTGEATDGNNVLMQALRIAVFVGADAETALCVGTLSFGGTDTVAGSIVGGQSPVIAANTSLDSMPTSVAAAGFDLNAGGTGNANAINGGQFLTIRLVAWFDGLMFTNAEAGYNVEFTLNFAGTAVVVTP